MHQDFDNKMPRHEQLARTAGAKTPGRKHQHRKGPGKAGNAAANKRRNIAKYKSQQAAPRKAAIRAYWTGETDEYPTGG